jgi:tRNA-dihydrouridine synthase B
MASISPIQIGPVRIETPVILAPMTGVTDMPFRRIVKRYGAGLTVTEMIASQAMIRETRQSLQKAAWDPAEEPVSMQLAGCSPKEMAEAAKLNEDRGAAIIDINMGCPVKKVVNGYAGSALMRDLTLAASIVDATVKAVKVPVTLKMRMGWDHAQPQRARACPHRAGSGRADDHRPRPHPLPDVQGRGRIGALGSPCKGRGVAPVIVNGDHLLCRGRGEAARCDQSGADGVMIGRGALWPPWLLRQGYALASTGKRLPDPSLGATAGFDP